MRLIPALLAAATLLSAADAVPPAATADAARQDMQVRIAQLEDQIRGLVAEQANAAGPAGAAASPDYAAAKARATADVRRRLDVIEYLLADNDYNRAVDTCNAVLADHPHEPATIRLKYRILAAMVERERALLERERAYRAEEVRADGQARGIVPAEPPVMRRTFWIFAEDVAAAERAVVQQRLKEPITLNYDGVEVGEVLKPLFAVAGINYVILDSALSKETLTLHLVNESIENALATIARLVKVHYNYSGSTVFIGAEDSDLLVSEIIRLESGLTDVVTEPQLPQAAGGNAQANGANGAGGAQPLIPQMGGAKGGQPGQQPGQQGQATSDLERFLDKAEDLIVGWPEKGRVYLDKKSNTVYVRATPAAISELRRLLHAMDYKSAQVLIEARFVEVSEDAMHSLGIDWSGGGSNGRITVGGPMGGGVQTPAAGLTFQELTTPVSAATAGSGGFNMGLLFSPSGMLGIKAAITALETEKKAETLSEPRILTLNNAVGTISLTTSFTYTSGYDVTQSTTAVATPTNGNINTVGTSVTTPVFNPQTTTVQLGYTLRIRPSIARNDDVITLDLKPSVTDYVPGGDTPQVVHYVPSASQAPQDFTYNIPQFMTRALATSLHVKNGQTVVLGGLTTDVTSTSNNGVPGLRSVPVLGRLFSSKKDTVTRSNLLIFVTAHIIDPSGAKIGEEIQRLKDTATVLLPEEARAAEAASRVVEEKRRSDAAAETKTTAEDARSKPPPSKTWQRR